MLIARSSPDPAGSHAAARIALLLVVLLALAAASPAGAAYPGRWRLSETDRVSVGYGRGFAPAGADGIFWAGDDALFRADDRLRERLHLVPAIPGFARSADRLTRLGDPAWDAARGRLLVPLGCPAGGCAAGAIAIFDRSLLWRGRVLLEPSEITLPAWAELDPGGELVWTSSGRDLLAYRAADLVPATGAAPMPGLRAARRLAGVAPDGEVGGAAFSDGRLLLATGGDPQRVWSLDVREGAEPDLRLELERAGSGRPAGLGLFDGRGGLLHLGIVGGSGRVSLLSYVPAADGALRMTVGARELRAGRPALLVVRVTQRFGGRTRPVAGARVSAGRWSARTDEDGSAELRVRPRATGTLRVRATKAELTASETPLTVAPAIGGVLSGLPRATVSAGGASVMLRAQRLLDCSGPDGCEAIGRPAPRGCVALGRGDLRVRLLRRPPREVSVLLLGPGGSRRASGLAQPGGRQGLGWRMRLSGARSGTGRLELLLVYADGTGALFAARTRPGRC